MSNTITQGGTMTRTFESAGEAFATARMRRAQLATGTPHRVKRIEAGMGGWLFIFWDVQERTNALIFGRWRTIATYDDDGGKQ